MSDRSRRQFISDSARLVGGGLLGIPLVGALESCDNGPEVITGAVQESEPLQPTTFRVRISDTSTELIDNSTGRLYHGGVALQPTREYKAGDELNLGFEFEEVVPATNPGIRRDVSKQFPGFAVFIGRWDWHALSPCVNSPVTHFHVQVGRTLADINKHKTWFNFHLGTYRNGNFKCFVLFDSDHKWICIKLCRPTVPGLQSMIYDGMRQGFATANVGVASAVLWAAAGVLAVAVFATLMAVRV